MIVGYFPFGHFDDYIWWYGIISFKDYNSTRMHSKWKPLCYTKTLHVPVSTLKYHSDILQNHDYGFIFQAQWRHNFIFPGIYSLEHTRFRHLFILQILQLGIKLLTLSCLRDFSCNVFTNENVNTSIWWESLKRCQFYTWTNTRCGSPNGDINKIMEYLCQTNFYIHSSIGGYDLMNLWICPN